MSIRPIETICVLGLGYIGLPTASLLATKGYRVFGVDIRRDVVETLNRGAAAFHEPDLDILVKSAVGSGRLTASHEPVPADVFIIAVPTPFQAGHVPDVSFVEAATRALAPHLRAGALVVLESTSPVGTTEQIAAWLAAARPDLAIAPKTDPSGQSVHVAHCPERVLPGQILKELVANDRVIGGIDGPSTARAHDLYRSFASGEILLTNSRTAELCKLAENAFRDVNIAFANELSIVCDRLDIDVWELIRLASRHPRVKILNPGPGVGGHCIAVDPWFIIHAAPNETPLAARGATGQRRQAGVGARKNPFRGHAFHEPAHRLPGPLVQGRCGRPPRKPRP